MMYSGSGYSDWEIGDIAIVYHKHQFHLFHLIIPNHDYIAHAVSEDGVSWRRVKNALFVGEPGEWDDDMLWTMHIVVKDDKFIMYYTGLQRRDRGALSRVGIAESEDLFNWKKVEKNGFPVVPKGDHYETLKNNPRGWISFRDPFYFNDGGKDYLLMCTRSSTGPVSRRGCVGLLSIQSRFVSFHPPLLYPMVYDDVECPCIFKLNDRYYLLGSIREDLRVRYWISFQFQGRYRSFHEDMLLPQGNYAARVVQVEDRLLVYNVYYMHGRSDSNRVLPPPKELVSDDRGRLLLKSYYGWDERVLHTISQKQFKNPTALFANSTASFKKYPSEWIFSSKSGYEIFRMQKASVNFIWEGDLSVVGLGKLGIVTEMDDEGNGYFISFDVINGLVDLRSWGFNPNDAKRNFVFEPIQTNVFKVADQPNKTFHFKLIGFGNYIELSIDGVVKITLMDYTWSGKGIGLYVASSTIALRNSTYAVLPDVIDEYASQA